MSRQFRPGQLQTGSLFNISSSFALTASYALNAGGSGTGFPFSGSAVITGSLEIKSDVNDIFIIKNFNNEPILTVSQSGVIVFRYKTRCLGSSRLQNVSRRFLPGSPSTDGKVCRCR